MQQVHEILIDATLPEIHTAYTIGNEIIGTLLSGELIRLAMTDEHPPETISAKNVKEPIVSFAYRVDSLCLGVTKQHTLIPLARYFPEMPKYAPVRRKRTKKEKVMTAKATNEGTK